jgi:hypothetical protein
MREASSAGFVVASVSGDSSITTLARRDASRWRESGLGSILRHDGLIPFWGPNGGRKVLVGASGGRLRAWVETTIQSVANTVTVPFLGK